MGIYACPRCGNPNGWWSGNMQDMHDCPGPPRRQWPGQPSELDWSECPDTSSGQSEPAPDIAAFTALLDKALHHARCAHALRDRSDRENTKPEYDKADAARQAVLDFFATRGVKGTDDQPK